DVRRRLARDAVRSGWSVRETENRVKLAGQPKARPERRPIDPEEAEALERAADAFETALGHEVSVRRKGEAVAIELRFDDLDEALAAARRLRRRG
ncbi:MAG TPA: chromosome partitioning protein ParB, partial [Solirubrobacterales bacterium]|nr:chromosome partitioning protein ParB [Solirubrobacterales bacterium]